MPARIKTLPKVCENCGSQFSRGVLKSGRLEDIADWRDRKYCSRKCYGEAISGDKHHNWTGGVKHRADGYLRDSKTDKYLHRLAVEKVIGRELLPTEHIHHINGIKDDNRPENLEIHSNSSHRKLEVLKARRDDNGRFSK